MAKVKLGSRECDVDSEVVNANFCGASAADVALLAARMKTGEISRLKTLNLVIFFRFVVCCSAPGLKCVVQNDNQIGDDGAQSIAAAVEGNSSLRELWLVSRFRRIFPAQISENCVFVIELCEG
jgi:hypothetical protein